MTTYLAFMAFGAALGALVTAVGLLADKKGGRRPKPSKDTANHTSAAESPASTHIFEQEAPA